MQNLLNFRSSSKIVSHKHSATTNWNFQLCDVISVLTPASKLGGGGTFYISCENGDVRAL